MKTTGVTSTSFRVWIATFLPGVASAVAAFVSPGSGFHQAVFGGGGAIVALVSTLGKLWHDKGLNAASLAAAGSDIAAALPQIRSDLSASVSFVENDVPGIKSAISDVTSRVAAVEARVAPDASAIESIVRNVLGELLAKANAPAP